MEIAVGAAARNGFFDFDELDKAYAALSPDAAETDGGEARCGVRTYKRNSQQKRRSFLEGGLHICITNRKLILMHKYIYICIDFFYVVQ